MGSLQGNDGRFFGNNSSIILNAEVRIIFCIDIGSTTTKLLAVNIDKRKAEKIVEEVVTPTTIEFPNNDISIALNELLKKIKTPICNDEVFITSSAGGGLKILVVALTSIFSGNSAMKAAEVSGGIVTDMVSLDYPLKNTDKFRKIKYSKPDMILFLGGTEGGMVSKIIEMAYILKNSIPETNSITGEKIPLIYAGNSCAIEHIQRILSTEYKIHIIENIRPSIIEEKTNDVKNIIQDIFTNHVMKYAPGFSKLPQYTQNPILPTPLAVAEYLAYIHQKTKKNILAIDLGGATTDIFTVINSNIQKTVVASSGLSFNIDKIYSNEYDEFAKIYLGFSNSLQKLHTYIGNKSINPQYHFTSEEEKKIEMLLGGVAIKRALQLHFGKNYFPIEVKKRYGLFTNDINLVKKRKKILLSKIDAIYLSGGIFKKLSVEEANEVINMGIYSTRKIPVFKDDYFVLPHLGNLLKNSRFNIENIAKRYLLNCGTTNHRYFMRMLKSKWKKNTRRKDHNNTFEEQMLPEFRSPQGIKKKIVCHYAIPSPFLVTVKKDDYILKGDCLAKIPERTVEIFTKSIYTMRGDSVVFLKKPKEPFAPGELLYKVKRGEKNISNTPTGLALSYSGRVNFIDTQNNVLVLERVYYNHTNNITISLDMNFTNLRNAVKIKQGDCIYENNLICLEGEKSIISGKATGVVDNIYYDGRKIILRPFNQVKEIVSFFEGKVKSIRNNNFEIILKGEVCEASTGFGENHYGKAILYSKHIKTFDRSIIFIDGKITEEEVKKAIMKSGKYFIFYTLSYTLFKKMQKMDVSVIVIAGFSNENISMPENIKNFVGKKIYFHPFTQIRAVCMRPFFIKQ